MKRTAFSNTSNKENGSLRAAKPRRVPLADITNHSDFLRRELQNELSPPSDATSQRPARVRATQNARGARSSSQDIVGSTALSPNTNCVLGARSSAFNTTGVIDNVSADEGSLKNEPLLSSVTSQTTSRLNPRPSLRQILSDPRKEIPIPPSASVSPKEGFVMALGADNPSGTSMGPQSGEGSGNCTDRRPWSALLVPAKTHKTSLGQVVILPSHSTLVDYREGERRKGRKGDEVMLVSPNGKKIQVFSAPHLSTPCCLAEPSATYTLNDLPTTYYKLYEQARKLMERIKKKIPKLVMYETNSTCILMLNDPLADLQITLDPHPLSFSSSNSTKEAGPHHTNTLRLCLSRKLHTIEISTSASSSPMSSVEEWHKKVLFWAGRGSGIDKDDYALLSAREKEGMKILFNFLPVVDAVESSGPEASPLSPLFSQGLASGSKTASKPLKAVHHCDHDPDVITQTIEQFSTLTLPDQPPTPVSLPTHSTIVETSSLKSFSTLNIAPRPRLSPIFPPNIANDTTRKASSTVIDNIPDSCPHSAVPMHAWLSKSKSGFSNAPAGTMDMRFLPTVGWCIRYGTGVYRIMFFDGAVLEVDVEDERVAFVGVDGEVERLTVRDCHAQRSVGERMKVFEDFVSMFDDSDR